MKIRTEIEIVTGFLGAGKTCFINALLKNTAAKAEKILVLQCETGEKNIHLGSYKQNKIIVKEIDSSKILNSNYLRQMIDFYNPYRVIIEHNGTKPLVEVLAMFNYELADLCVDPVVYHITDAVTFDMFITNMKELIEPFIYHSNLIVINNCSFLEAMERKSLVKKIEHINQNAFIFTLKNIRELGEVLDKSDVLDNGIIKNFRIALKNKGRK
jgi:G3E family GTPase